MDMKEMKEGVLYVKYQPAWFSIKNLKLRRVDISFGLRYVVSILFVNRVHPGGLGVHVKEIVSAHADDGVSLEGGAYSIFVGDKDFRSIHLASNRQIKSFFKKIEGMNMESFEEELVLLKETHGLPESLEVRLRNIVEEICW